jgi:hypothetical protein
MTTMMMMMLMMTVMIGGDDVDNNSNSVQNIFTFFACLLNCPYANYRASRGKEMQNQTQTRVQIQDKQHL